MPFQPNVSEEILFVLTVLTGLVLSLLMPKQGPTTIIFLALTFLALHIGANWYLWAGHNVSLPYFILVALTLTLSIYFSTTGYFSEAQNKKQITNMFGQYVPPAYLDKLIRAGKELELKSERREMTVLFTDVRKFTSISEGMTPEELSSYLNKYFSVVTEIIFDYHGTIDKYVGDMVMAFWNAPLDTPNHAEQAVLTALKMTEETESLSVEFQAKGLPKLQTGTGISTGLMSVGDMGSKYRRSYTVLGDSVNLGSRLEGLTKYYGVSILVSETTQAACPNIGFRKIDTVQVVGKNVPVEIYEPLGLRENLSSMHESLLLKHQKAMLYYFAQEWGHAEQLFTELLEQKILSTKVYLLYLERIASLKEQSLPDDWDGVMKHVRK